MNIKKLFACLGSSVFLFAVVAGCAPKVIESEELLAPQWEAPSYETDVKVGAIRWDAWIGEVSPAQGETVEVSLSPEKYHYRIPWYGEILDEPVLTAVHEDARDNDYFIYNDEFPKNDPLSPLASKSITASATTQEEIDKEIRFAKASGIDYWAILWYDYGMDSAMRLQRDLFLSSLQRNAMEWCHILGGGFATAAAGGSADTNEYIQSVIESMKMDNYLKTETGRPVVQVFEPETWMTQHYSKFYAECEKQGIDPYVVGLIFDTTASSALPRLQAIEAEGVGAYATGHSGGISYEEHMSSEAYNWESYASFGLDVVPPITTGWDKRPRYDYPNPWEYSAADSFKDQWVEQGSPEQIAQHMSNGMDFVEDNGSEYEFRSVLLYAWNENDEGGWINPTLFEMRDEGRPLRLDAIRDKIADHRVRYKDIVNSKYVQSIEALANSYVFENVNGDMFESGRSVSVAEFICWTMRAFGFIGEDFTENAETFFNDDVALAKELEILDSAVISDADIRLTRRISPAQAKSILSNCVKVMGMAETDAAGAEFVSSKVDNALYNGKITRGAAAQMILDVLEMPYKNYSWLS